MSAEPRHATPRIRGGRRRWAVAVACAVVAVVTGTATVVHVGEPSRVCDSYSGVLEVVASPDIAPVVSRTAKSVRSSAGCPLVRVRSDRPSDVLVGLRQPGARVPDVWIPDSSLWVERVRNEQLVTPVEQQSIASSPLVVALPRGFADRLSRGEGRVSWDDVVATAATGQLVLHLPGPETAPATVGLLLALQPAVEPTPDERAAVVALLRSTRLEPEPAGSRQALAVLGSSRDGAVPVTEQAVFQHGDLDDAAPLTAAYPSTAGTPFDYPYTILRADGGALRTAERLLAALRDTDGRARLRAAGFRDTDGTGGDELPEDRGVDGSHPGTVAVPDVATVDGLLQSFEALRRDTRLLAVMDVSGSMAAPVPDAGGSTRLDLALRAAAAGLELYPDTTDVGLWSFSENLPGGSDYQELVPIAPLTSHGPGGRDAVALALTQVQPVPNGGTGLYDTALAAVRAVRAGWDPERVNAVVLLSDGEDTDDDGIGLDQLLATLRSEQSDGRLVPVFTIAYGEDAGAQALAAVSAATGGASYQTSDPTRIRDIFLDAIGQRTCRPRCSPTGG